MVPYLIKIGRHHSFHFIGEIPEIPGEPHHHTNNAAGPGNDETDSQKDVSLAHGLPLEDAGNFLDCAATEIGTHNRYKYRPHIGVQGVGITVRDVPQYLVPYYHLP